MERLMPSFQAWVFKGGCKIHLFFFKWSCLSNEWYRWWVLLERMTEYHSWIHHMSQNIKQAASKARFPKKMVMLTASGDDVADKMELLDSWLRSSAEHQLSDYDHYKGFWKLKGKLETIVFGGLGSRPRLSTREKNRKDKAANMCLLYLCYKNLRCLNLWGKNIDKIDNKICTSEAKIYTICIFEAQICVRCIYICSDLLPCLCP